MRIQLLGTGSADGWPNPWCSCASCAAMRARGETRGNTSALVDDSVLLELAPDGLRLADRQHISLTGVRTVLVTHAHPDHLAPATLLWRQWAAVAGELELLGPPRVVESARAWLGESLRARSVRAGETVQLASGHMVTALAAAHGDESTGECLLWLLERDGQRALWATDTGSPLPRIERRLDALLLECTTGDGPDIAGHLGLRSWAEALAELRRAGVVDEQTTVVPIHLGHRNPAPPQLQGRFAALGATVLGDGEVVPGSGSAPLPLRVPHRVLVTGGARSGKSLFAERLVAAEPAVTYLATSLPRPDDADWRARVRAHRERRPAAWHTVETTAVAAVLRSTDQVLLIDCATLWLGAHLDSTDREAKIDELVQAWTETRTRAVFVTNEVGSSVHPATETGRDFADTLGRLNARLAEAADQVWLVVAGQPLRLR